MMNIDVRSVGIRVKFFDKGCQDLRYIIVLLNSQIPVESGAEFGILNNHSTSHIS